MLSDWQCVNNDQRAKISVDSHIKNLHYLWTVSGLPWVNEVEEDSGLFFASHIGHMMMSASDCVRRLHCKKC